MAGPRTTVEAQAFYRMYHSYADIPNPWDRLRWCRYGLDLLQKDVAAMVGMEEWLYRDLESGAFHRSFTPELADKLAALYGIPVEDILDDYTLFLYRGGGDFLRRYREAKGWSRQQLADHAKVSRTSIRCGESGHLFLLQKVSCEVSCLTPLYILQVPLAGPHTTSEAQAFFHMYHSYSEITNPSDRMRWCRYGLDLLQKEVAAMVGMEEWLYRDLESGAFHRSFTPEFADKLAALYSIPVEDILDDYTLFLHRGGGDFLRRYREAKGWSRQQLADHAKVGRTSIRCWETEQKTISQKCFRLLAENLGPDFLSMLRM